jgi:hypothetical protein
MKYCENCVVSEGKCDKLQMKELKTICKSKGLKKYSKLKKQGLIDLLKKDSE